MLEYSSTLWNTMIQSSHRQFKDQLYAAWAEIGKVLASPKRIELLDLIAQGERTVEALARETGLTVNNTSSHLNVLKTARLVGTRREAQFVCHHLVDDGVVALLRAVQALARRRLPDVDQLARTHLDDRDEIEPIDAKELQRRLHAGNVLVIDVRPIVEYEAGHIEGARSIPVDRLRAHLDELPKDREIVAYCRGPYCVFAVEAVRYLRGKGYSARRLDVGLPDWRAAGRAVVRGASEVTPSTIRTVVRRRPARAKERGR